MLRQRIRPFVQFRVVLKVWKQSFQLSNFGRKRNLNGNFLLVSELDLNLGLVGIKQRSVLNEKVDHRGDQEM